MENNYLSIKEYWDNQAKQFKGSSLATSPDTIAYDMEIAQMQSMLLPKSTVLDIGCGNGIKGFELVKDKDIQYYGMDYSDEMIKQAKILFEKNKEPLKGTARFFVGNVLDSVSFDKLFHNMEFDYIMTDRCLINLQTIENQANAVKNLYAVLKKNGKYLMFENSIQSLNNLNEVREDFDLSKIEVRWHNIYIDEIKFFPLIKEYFSLKQTINFASTYYLISRTINALVTNNNQIDYNSEINKLAAKLPALGDFAPIKLFVLEKK